MSNAFFYRSPLGTLRVEENSGALVISAFVSDAEATEPSSPMLSEAKAWLDRYFEGTDPGPVPPVNPEGTAFQKAVFSALSSVPYGETISYGELAIRMGRTARHARAAGSALHRNPILLFLPCHRVLGKDGSLTGFAGGLVRKQALLKLEQKSRD